MTWSLGLISWHEVAGTTLVCDTLIVADSDHDAPPTQEEVAAAGWSWVPSAAAGWVPADDALEVEALHQIQQLEQAAPTAAPDDNASQLQLEQPAPTAPDDSPDNELLGNIARALDDIAVIAGPWVHKATYMWLPNCVMY